jgi:PncC family amidohydrolase
LDYLPPGQGGEAALEVQVGALLAGLHLTLATAESCTGGLLAHRITNAPGSSAYFQGGVVAYAYEAKETLLGVDHQTLEARGAVSPETAREMAQGARQRLGADLALAITGIAGPTGGTAEKPVGLVYVALASADGDLCERHIWQDDQGRPVGRLAHKEHSVEAALRMLRRYLRGPMNSSTCSDHAVHPSERSDASKMIVHQLVGMGKGESVFRRDSPFSISL